jgi:hypothetical protein
MNASSLSAINLDYGRLESMRTCLSFLLAIMLSLNASYVASAAVCGALEQSASHAAHFGHHSHEHSDEHDHDAHAQDDPQVSADEAGKVTTASDHHHHHVHPSFSSILPDIIGVMPLTGSSPLVAAPPSVFISASHILFDRPPRASLA